LRATSERLAGSQQLREAGVSEIRGGSAPGERKPGEPKPDKPKPADPAPGKPKPADPATVEQPPPSSRREFLIGAATAGAAAAGGVFAARALGGTRLPIKTLAARAAPAKHLAVARPVWPMSGTGKPTSADWTALQRRLHAHTLIRPGQPSYVLARQLFEPRFDSIEPAAIAYCHTSADVATCLSFVRTFGIPVRARSGGHSYAGWSTVADGLIIDVSGISSVSFRDYGPRYHTVTVGAGVDLMHFYAELAARGLSVPAGSCPTVGIAGLTLGGGVGVLSRRYGLTSDTLEAVQLVTASGSVLDCDDTHDSDLFWACRGGGGGNFGVATSFTFRAQRLDTLQVFSLTWPWSDAARVVHAWQAWAPHAPDRLWSTMHLSAPFGGPPTLSVGGTYAGSQPGLAGHLDDLSFRIGTGPATEFIRPESYLNAMLLEADCAAIPLHSCHTGAGGQLPRVPSFAKSSFFTRPLRSSGIRALLAGIERLRGIQGAEGGLGTVALDACGGAMNEYSPTATAFVHRNALFLAQFSTTWTSRGARSGVDNQHRWLRAYHRSLLRHASGQAYQNYIDPDLADWRWAYYGANYDRLTQVKTAYDPTNLFSFPQSIEPRLRRLGRRPELAAEPWRSG
jgi:FAD/FMN-containing dehydrogenase